jgi:hypothetical protein
MPGNDRSRPGEGGSDKTIAAVDTSIELSADIPADLDLGPSLMARWRRQAHAAIAQLADSGEEFTVDTLIGLVGRPPITRQLSGIFAAAKRRGQIEQVGAKVADDGRVVRRWRGVEVTS